MRPCRLPLATKGHQICISMNQAAASHSIHPSVSCMGQHFEQLQYITFPEDGSSSLTSTQHTTMMGMQEKSLPCRLEVSPRTWQGLGRCGNSELRVFTRVYESGMMEANKRLGSWCLWEAREGKRGGCQGAFAQRSKAHIFVCYKHIEGNHRSLKQKTNRLPPLPNVIFQK